MNRKCNHTRHQIFMWKTLKSRVKNYGSFLTKPSSTMIKFKIHKSLKHEYKSEKHNSIKAIAKTSYIIETKKQKAYSAAFVQILILWLQDENIVHESIMVKHKLSVTRFACFSSFFILSLQNQFNHIIQARIYMLSSL